jgi:hypothetical protein
MIRLPILPEPWEDDEQLRLRHACNCPIDFDKVNTEALRQIRRLLSAFVPNSPLPEFLTAEAAGGGSFVDDRTGQWADVSAGARGGDLVSLIGHLLRLDRREAAKFLAVVLEIDDWRLSQ